MTQSEIDHIERSLGVTLPEEYAELLRTHEFFGEQERHFCLDPAFLIEENQRLRKEGYYLQPWPDDYLWIGSGWGGEVFLINLSGGSTAVYMCDWNNIQKDGELPPLKLINDTVCEFVQDLDEMPADE